MSEFSTALLAQHIVESLWLTRLANQWRGYFSRGPELRQNIEYFKRVLHISKRR